MIKATRKEDKGLLQNGKEYLTCCEIQRSSLQKIEKGVPYML